MPADQDERERAREDDHGDVQLVEIGSVVDGVEGAMLREYLASHGIHCLLQGEHHNSLLPGIGSHIISPRLMVPSTQADQAVALLRAFHDPDREKDGETEDERAEGEEDEDEQEGDEQDHDDERDQHGDEAASSGWRDPAEHRRLVRRVQVASLMLPGLGVGHFAAGARVRGVILLTSWPIAVWLSRSMGAAAFGLVAISTALDFLATPAAMTELRRHRRDRSLPRARVIGRDAPPED